MNLALLLEMAAEGAPERTVVGSRTAGLAARELLLHARRAAQLFRDRGVEHVAQLGVNSEVVPITLFGAAIAGLPFAPVNFRLPDDQLRAIMARLAPAVVVVDPDMTARVSELEGIQVITRTDLLDAVASDGDEGEGDFVDPDSTAILLFTSGTTGEPKAAVLRHRHLTAYIIGTVECLGADESEAQLVSVPSYHVAGIATVLSSVYGGRRIAYLPGFDAETWLATVDEERITQAMVVPTMLGRIVQLIEDGHGVGDSLRHVSYGGGRMPLELIERAIKLLPDVNFVNAYGLTETSSTISVLTPEDHRE